MNVQQAIWYKKKQQIPVMALIVLVACIASQDIHLCNLHIVTSSTPDVNA